MTILKRSSLIVCAVLLHILIFSVSFPLRIWQFLRIIFEEDGESSSDTAKQEHALAKGVDVMAMSLGNDTALDKADKQESQDATAAISGTVESPEAGTSGNFLGLDKLSLDDVPVNNHRKMALLYALLSACVADKPVLQEQEDRKSSHLRKGYDARHRAALRLLATWLDVKWIKMVRTKLFPSLCN
jgi:hypothetical protein